MHLRLLNDRKGTIPYRSKLTRVTGSVTSAILLQQLAYWFERSGGKFYKFKEACDHADYQPGDSWCEELGFTRREFDTAIKRIGKKVRPTTAVEDYPTDVFAVYYTDITRKTFYWVNEQKIELMLRELYDQPYVKAESAASKGGKRQHVKAESAFTNRRNPPLVLYTETTTESTTETNTETQEHRIENSESESVEKNPSPPPASVASRDEPKAVVISDEVKLKVDLTDRVEKSRATMPYASLDQRRFDAWRVSYPGKLMGLTPSWELFKRKCRALKLDGPQELDTLVSALDEQLAVERAAKYRNEFHAQWRNMQTYLNNYGWQDEPPGWFREVKASEKKKVEAKAQAQVEQQDRPMTYLEWRQTASPEEIERYTRAKAEDNRRKSAENRERNEKIRNLRK